MTEIRRGRQGYSKALEVWFFELEGRSLRPIKECGNEHIGFIVACVVAAVSEEAGLELIRRELAEDQLKIDFVSQSGLLDEFFWKDEEFTRRMRSYGQDALATGQAFFDTFQSWPLRKGKA